jgi:hypothetical protein
LENCNEHSKATATGYFAKEAKYCYGEGAKSIEATVAKGFGCRNRLANAYSGFNGERKQVLNRNESGFYFLKEKFD